MKICVSGGFDPLHVGHVRLFKAAKKLGDELIVIINNDNWLIKKKGFKVMDEKDRKEIIESIRFVNEVVLTKHEPGSEDISVCESLKEIRPDIFANWGDRKGDNIPEYQLCEELGIKMKFNMGVGGKIRSSSELVKKEQTNLHN